MPAASGCSSFYPVVKPNRIDDSQPLIDWCIQSLCPSPAVCLFCISRSFLFHSPSLSFLSLETVADDMCSLLDNPSARMGVDGKMPYTHTHVSDAIGSLTHSNAKSASDTNTTFDAISALHAKRASRRQKRLLRLRRLCVLLCFIRTDAKCCIGYTAWRLR